MYVVKVYEEDSGGFLYELQHSSSDRIYKDVGNILKGK